MEEVEKLLEKYQEKPVLKALVQTVTIPVTISQGNTSFQIIIPAGLLFDAALAGVHQKLRATRLKVLFEELETGQLNMTSDLIESEEFIHRFLITTNAALKTYQEEKIKRFARLFKNSISAESYSGIDDFEELLGILDELSDRGWWILIALEKYEIEFPPEAGENDAQRASRFWEEFVHEIEGTLNIPQEEIISSLVRLTRSGCFRMFTGMYFEHNMGRLTEKYYRLSKLVREKDTFLQYHKKT